MIEATIRNCQTNSSRTNKPIGKNPKAGFFLINSWLIRSAQVNRQLPFISASDSDGRNYPDAPHEKRGVTNVSINKGLTKSIEKSNSGVTSSQ